MNDVRSNKICPKIMLGTGQPLNTILNLFGVSSDIKTSEPVQTKPPKFVQTSRNKNENALW